MLLSVIASAFGLAIGYGLVQILTWAAPDGLPRLDEVTMDGRVLAFALEGGTPTAVVSGQSSADALALDGCNVYWTNTVDKTVMAASR